MSNERLFTISELASMFDISSRTIRYYEEVGLLSSETRSSLASRRTYTNKERRRLKMILRGKKLGFSLQEIKDMIDLYEKNPEGEEEKIQILQYANKKIAEIEEQIAQLEMLKGEIMTHIEKYK